MKSEYGRGLTYPLGLFLAHAERLSLTTETKGIINEQRDAELWFYAAADHLFELEVEFAPTARLKRRLRKFKKKGLTWRLPRNKKLTPSKKDKEWAIQEAKDLLRLIDKANGVPTAKGDYE